MAEKAAARPVQLPAGTEDDDALVRVAPQSECLALAKAVAETRAQVQADELLQREEANPMTIHWLLHDIQELQMEQKKQKERQGLRQEEDEEERERRLDDFKATQKLKRRRARETAARCKGRNDQWEERRKSIRDAKLHEQEDQMYRMQRLEAERKIKCAELAFKRRLVTGMPDHLLAEMTLAHTQEVASLKTPTQEELEEMQNQRKVEDARLMEALAEKQRLARLEKKRKQKAHELHVKQQQFQQQVKGYSKALVEMQDIKETVMPRLQERASRPGQADNPLRHLMAAITLGESPSAFLTTKCAKHGTGALAVWAKNVQYRFMHHCQRVCRSKKRKREEKRAFLCTRVLDDFRDFCRTFPGCRRRGGGSPLHVSSEGKPHPPAQVQKLLTPSFRLLHTVVEFIITLTGFGDALFTEEEQDVETFHKNVRRLAKREQDAANKRLLQAQAAYLSKIITHVENHRMKLCNVDAKQMVRGKQACRTLNFLRILLEVGADVYDKEAST
jgi:hypothetical protein